jgi:Restriction endonuclease PvuII
LDQAVILSSKKPKLPIFKHHHDKAELDKIFPHLRLLQKLATKYGIRDIFQDNGGKLLQIALVTGLTIMPKREGNDAKDSDGREYELKSVNASLTKSFSTHHHLNPVILKKYRAVGWVFAIYESIELQAVYYMPPSQLEPYFSTWEKKWHDSGGKDINNPKIPLKFVVKNGHKIFPADPK